VALAPEQEAAELFLQGLDGAGEHGLGNVTVLGRTGEVQGLANLGEVADLMHFHRGAASATSWPGVDGRGR
jgi:hypothetical protein